MLDCDRPPPPGIATRVTKRKRRFRARSSTKTAVFLSGETQPAVAEPLADALAFTDTLI